MALILETSWFLNDFKIVQIPFLSYEEVHTGVTSVGTIQSIKRNVRRRSQESIVWEDSNESDLIYNFDSILTLPESAATISLVGDTKITMAENTLILIEPVSQEKDSKIRLRFAKGDINARKLSKATEIKMQEWTVDASTGSEINLRQVDGGKVEVEVIKGGASLKGKKEVRAMEQGQILSLAEDKVVEEKKIAENLKWVTENGSRYYSFELPVAVKFRWQGQAEKIWHLDARKDLQWHEVVSGQNETTIKLSAGLHSLRLVNKGVSSTTIAVNVWEAPTMHLLSPLPRDRIHSGDNTTFSWRSSPLARVYKIQFSDKSDFSRILYESKGEDTFTSLALKREGQFFWRIEGLDDRGFEIPALYSNPIYNFNELFEAPIIKPPKARQPAAEKPGASLWNLFFSPANAETGYDVIFEWEPVAGAEHYMIEIDRDGTFQNPLVMAKVENSKYMWTGALLDKYYWRVAAGKGGTMGKFSAPQPLDLKLVLTNSQIGEDQGVTIKKADVEKPVAKPETKLQPQHMPKLPPKVTPRPPLVIAKEEKKLATPAPEPVAKAPEALPPPPEYKTKWSGGIFLGTLYEVKKLGAPNSTKVNFSDFVPWQLGFFVNMAYSENRELVFQSEYTNNKWQPKTTSSLPLQGNITDQNLRNGLYVRDRKNELGYGLYFSQLSLVKRTGSDQIGFDNQWLFGVGFIYPSYWQSYKIDHSVSVSSDFSSRNLYEFFFGNKFVFDYRRLQLIVSANLFYQFSSQQPDSWGIQVGPALGISW